jgi:hypothetical protein
VDSRLAAGLSHDYGVHPYSKWRGAFWRLCALVDLGADARHKGALAAAEQTLSWLASRRRLRRIEQRKINGRVRRCATQDGLGLFACRQLGLSDARLDVLARSLVDTQWPDGGWNCDVRPDASHSSFHESWGPVLGLAAYGARDAVTRGAEFLLRHRLVFSERTGQPADPGLLRLRYPPYWHYDLLVGLRTLALTVGLADPRAGDALDLLLRKRDGDGTWRCEGTWWKRPGSSGSNVEAVDWGAAADQLLTLHANAVLEQAGREARVREALPGPR